MLSRLSESRVTGRPRTDARYLLAIWSVTELDGVAVTITGLAAHLDVNPGSLSARIARLVQLGLVDHARYKDIIRIPRWEPCRDPLVARRSHRALLPSPHF